MNVLALDTEITTWFKGSPFDERNRLVCCSWYTPQHEGVEYYNGDVVGRVHSLVNDVDRVVGFNFKFDYHWFNREGARLDPRKFWDVQLAEFILGCQTNPYPSLEETAQKYGFGGKIDVIKTEYWDKGINTDEIPRDILSEYAILDAKLTYLCYEAQIKLMTPAQIRLCQLQSQDLAVLAAMEATGLPFDEELCQVRAKELDDQVSEINRKLAAIYPNIPINFRSNDHLSAFLYGGVVKEDSKEFIGFYKTGQKAGLPKYQNVTIEHQLPRLYTPLKGSEMKKQGNFAVDEGTLRKLKGKRTALDLILELSKLEKLNGTYYRGLIALREERGWPKGVLHGNFNQTTAVSGRLSSSKPNLQNFASELQDIFISRYND